MNFAFTYTPYGGPTLADLERELLQHWVATGFTREDLVNGRKSNGMRRHHRRVGFTRGLRAA